jgi:alcohol dehydrogenase class IV
VADVPTRLADYGVKREDLQDIAELASASASVDNNPRQADANTLLDLLKKAY